MIGLIDQLVLEIDENPPYEVVNDDSYNKFKTSNSIPMIYALKSQSKDTRASDIHNHFISVVSNHKVKLLEPESVARTKTKTRDAEKLVDELMPFTYTDLLVEEIMNLEYRQAGNQTQVKQISKSINKDKFSALEYGLYYIHLQEKKNRTRKKETIDISKLFMFKQPNL